MPAPDDELSIAGISPGAATAIALALASLDARGARIEAAILATAEAQRAEATQRAAAWSAVGGLVGHPAGRAIGYGGAAVVVLGVARWAGVADLLVGIWPGLGL